MTALTIFLACAIKGVLLAIGYKRGWFRTPQQVADDVQGERAVLLAYREWRKNAGPEATADLTRRLTARRASSRTSKKIV